MSENNIFISKINEYADLSYMREDFVKFSDFLDEFESATVTSVYKNRYFDNYLLFGGYDDAERKMLCVYSGKKPDDFPIVFLKIYFNNTEYLGHRNILGALMNLNIKRSMIGDICIIENFAVVICKSIVGEIIKNELKSVGKSSVNIEYLTITDFVYAPKTITETHIVASERLDAIVASLCNLSRSDACEKISAGLVFLNGEIIKNVSKKVCAEAKITVRGYGRFQLLDLSGRTHKDRIKLVIKKFI
jgi:RNA-binding protein YlmH